jgi:hypothetical protein
MSALQTEWITLLQQQEIPGWTIGADGGDILIKVPDDQDLALIYANFPDTIIVLKPDIKSQSHTLRFIVGSSSNSFQYTLD